MLAENKNLSAGVKHCVSNYREGWLECVNERPIELIKTSNREEFTDPHSYAFQLFNADPIGLRFRSTGVIQLVTLTSKVENYRFLSIQQQLSGLFLSSSCSSAWLSQTLSRPPFSCSLALDSLWRRFGDKIQMLRCVWGEHKATWNSFPPRCPDGFCSRLGHLLGLFGKVLSPEQPTGSMSLFHAMCLHCLRCAWAITFLSHFSAVAMRRTGAVHVNERQFLVSPGDFRWPVDSKPYHRDESRRSWKCGSERIL